MNFELTLLAARGKAMLLRKQLENEVSFVHDEEFKQMLEKCNEFEEAGKRFCLYLNEWREQE